MIVSLYISLYEESINISIAFMLLSLRYSVVSFDRLDTIPFSQCHLKSEGFSLVPTNILEGLQFKLRDKQ